MARIPCSFSAQEEFVARIDARAEELGMKRSEYIVHALRRELMGSGGPMSIVTEQNVSGVGNKAVQKNFSSTSHAPDAKSSKAKRGKTKPGK